MAATKFKEKIKAAGYFDKVDDSLLDISLGLVRGSFNVLITDEWKVAVRKGLALLGAAGTLITGIKSSYTWQTSTNLEIPLRSRYDTLQALYLGTWVDIATGFKTLTKFRFSTWWDRTEIKDRLLFVNGSKNVYSWTGGMSEVGSATVNTLSKKYASQSSVVNSFTFDAVALTLTQAVGVDFVNLGFAVNQKLRVAGTVSNDGIYTIRSVTPSVITFSVGDILTNETVASTNCMIGVLGRETWAADRFTVTGDKTFVMGGQVFTWASGENTPTLQGVSPDPSVLGTLGAFVYNRIVSAVPAGTDFPVGQLIDLISTNINQVMYGYTQSRNCFLSKQNSYTDVNYTLPIRQAGDGGTIFLDNVATSISTDEDKTYITAGKSDVYQVTFSAFSDGVSAGETLNVRKAKTSYGQGAASQEGVVKVKNGLAYVSFEPTIDFLGNVEQITTAQALPLSDPIKRLLNRLDNTGVCGIYAKNNLFFLFPNESILLIYDMERQFWQPPQIVSGSSLSVIGGNPHVHSLLTDETYRIFSGLTDNGKPIAAVANFNVDTYGTRSTRKIYDEIYIEAILNGAANQVKGSLLTGYKGATKIQNFLFGFSDPSRFLEAPALPSGFGTASFGTQPFGGLFTDPEIDSEIGPVKKLYKVFGTNDNDNEAFTHQFSFSDDELGAYWELVSFGTNATASPTSNVDIKDD